MKYCNELQRAGLGRTISYYFGGLRTFIPPIKNCNWTSRETSR